MDTKQRLWAISGTLAILGIGALIFSAYWFHWAWTGFNKTLWDWMQLLIIPVALALVAIWFNHSERKNEQRITSDNQQEAALQAYLDRLSELLMKEGLRTSKLEDEVRTVARVRTLTVLHQLDEFRKADVIQFLHDSDLICVDADKCVIDLAGADLWRAYFFKPQRTDLSGVCLIGAELNFADFTYADLNEADLIGAEFIETNLSKATLSNANLSYADFSEADLSEVNLSKALLSRADLSDANLNEADLSEAKLIRANLSSANLSRANLSKANLRDANLSRADLSGANLNDADLRGVDLSEANFNGATINNKTKLSKNNITLEQLKMLKAKGITHAIR